MDMFVYIKGAALKIAEIQSVTPRLNGVMVRFINGAQVEISGVTVYDVFKEL